MAGAPPGCAASATAVVAVAGGCWRCLAPASERSRAAAALGLRDLLDDGGFRDQGGTGRRPLAVGVGRGGRHPHRAACRGGTARSLPLDACRNPGDRLCDVCGPSAWALRTGGR